MWIGTNQGLYQYNPITKSIVTFKHADNNLTSLINDHVNTITEDQLGNIWIGTDRGISKYNKDNKVFLNYQLHRGNNITLRNNIIFSISVDGENAWIGTADGLDILNTRTNEHSTYAPDNRNSHSLSSKLVRSIFIDKQGIFWLGTIRGGVNKFDRNLNLFNSVRSNVFDTQGLNARVATAFAETKDGKVFVGTDSKGVSLFNPTNRLFEHINIKSARNGNELYVIALEMSRQNKLLIGTLEDGLFALNIATGKCKQLLKGSTTDSLNSNEIHVVTTLRNGDIAVGTNGDGINILDSNYKVKLRYTRQPRMSNDKTLPLNAYIRDIKEDKDGNIWIGTHGGGMAELNLLSGKFTIYNSTNSPMPNDKVQSICIDSQGKVWAGTFGGGLVSFNPYSKQFESYSEKNGLQNNTVYTVIEDQVGLIWVSTNNGISSINPRTKKVNNYNYHNGIQHNNFVRGAGTLLTNGTLLFGGLDGFNYFNPSEIIVNSNIPPVQLTGLRIANQLVIASKDGPISEHISIAKEMSVDYQQSFSLEFVGLSYTSPEQNRYAYQMEGYDKDWIDAGNATSATYMNLAPGHYTFTVKSSNNDGVWNTKGAAIKVYVRPPLWRTTFAYTFYILALAGIGFYIRHKSIQNLRRKLVLQQEKIMAEQERREVARVHELDQQKIKFLTNLSHEFRTPISLILGPVDNLLAKEHSLQSYRQLDMIKRNGRRLLNLVNQLLDFRKMEEHELQLNKTHGELITFIKDVADSFKDLAERKEMNFYFHSEVNKFYTTFDHDKIERVLFNVLSNAFKFTRPGGTIELAIQKIDNIADDINTWMAITIRDTGIGMTDEVKEKIFSLFFQQATDASILNQGTGIGLTITKEFVKMHGGKN
jgi:signal transduction histidine kinase/ligand-binding sensor domain-containing protein